ncbi:MAG: hypothetical protein H5T85_08490 [Actinobacteria bacterium]|nr:hypothetical protein [Actinomycetota bacterium]
MSEIDIKKLRKAPYMTKRLFIIKRICESRDIGLEYLFGLFNLYNVKNRGRWFWQKATFSGALKEAFDKFNSDIDEVIKDLKSEDEEYTLKKVKIVGNTLDNLLSKLEVSLDVERERDKSYVEGYLDDNLRALIRDGLKGME